MNRRGILTVLAICFLLILPGCGNPSPIPVPSPPSPPLPTHESPPSPTPMPELNVPPLKPAEFKISGLNISPSEVVCGEPTTISADIVNIGGTEGTHNVILKVDGVRTGTKDITLAAGDKETVVFTVTKNNPGSYQVEFENLTGNLRVIIPERTIPIPGPDHPGNVFLVGEEVTVNMVSGI